MVILCRLNRSPSKVISVKRGLFDSEFAVDPELGITIFLTSVMPLLSTSGKNNAWVKKPREKAIMIVMRLFFMFHWPFSIDPDSIGIDCLI